MRERLGWPAREIVVRAHRRGVSLAFEAPVTALLTATEVNEWAWLGAIDAAAPVGPDQVPVGPDPVPVGPDQVPLKPAQAPHDLASALPLFLHLAADETPLRFGELLDAAAVRGVPTYPDDSHLSVGAGRWSRTWPMLELPDVADVPWADLRGIPVTLVGGSNGKTTTVRLISAMCSAFGWRTGYSSTDGVRVDDAVLETGDWSGPAGARAVLRDARVEAAVLETARGGILRRGLAVSGARAAVITNIQLDHIGEDGIDVLNDLTAVKMVVAKGLAADGVLVLNGDDPQLIAAASTKAWSGRVAWFSLDANAPMITAARAAGTPCAVLHDTGALELAEHGTSHALGNADAMPLTVGGLARYNIANALGAALAARAMGVDVEAVAQVLAQFGSDRNDNPGRLVRWTIDGATILLDYAHNPEGIAGVLRVAAALRATGGRLIVLLGQAGDRSDDAIRALARTVAAAGPAYVVLKELEEFMRGRAAGEVPAILAAELRTAGLGADALETCATEVDGARAAVRRARAGDVVVLPVHARRARDEVSAWLDGRVTAARQA